MRHDLKECRKRIQQFCQGMNLSQEELADFYYVFTTIDVLNLPRFAAFFSFCDKLNNFGAKFIVGKLRQIGAKYGI